MTAYYQVSLAILILLALAWVFFRYIIRLVKANEAMADSIDEIAQTLKNMNEILSQKEIKREKEER